jgi:uncharacterized protein YoxC
MTSVPVNLPKELSAKQWRGNKGLFTKAVSDKTGMGAALDKLEKAWAAVPWKTVIPDQATVAVAGTGDVTTAMLDKLEPLAQAQQAKVETVKKEVRAVEALAKKTGDTWKTNKLMPASSVKYVGQVHSAATALATALDELDEGWKAFRFTAERGRLHRTDKAIVETQIRGAIAGLRAATQAAQAKLSLPVYRKMGAERTKSIEALSKSSDQAHQALKAALESTVSGFVPRSSDDAESDQAVAEVNRVAAVLRNA